MNANRGSGDMKVTTSRFEDRYINAMYKWYHFALGIELAAGSFTIALIKWGIHIEW